MTEIPPMLRDLAAKIIATYRSLSPLELQHCREHTIEYRDLLIAHDVIPFAEFWSVLGVAAEIAYSVHPDALTDQDRADLAALGDTPDPHGAEPPTALAEATEPEVGAAMLLLDAYTHLTPAQLMIVSTHCTTKAEISHAAGATNYANYWHLVGALARSVLDTPRPTS